MVAKREDALQQDRNSIAAVRKRISDAADQLMNTVRHFIER
jgi:hypothetical protein